ncbi:hypothetical protein L873DRAFT_80646 [Choiromyces venosus 120613-1]|uniref:Uncharacterized protein n=1 Tax=Choiromyces venosus 120613-1 TaxID=1336337 RepID=A0A3N4J915_9PEZI|nr:hypothetical protein L873DRAFT_80646 [Choiromyces venosus 120613-1]
MKMNIASYFTFPFLRHHHDMMDRSQAKYHKVLYSTHLPGRQPAQTFARKISYYHGHSRKSKSTTATPLSPPIKRKKKKEKREPKPKSPPLLSSSSTIASISSIATRSRSTRHPFLPSSQSKDYKHR